MTSYMEWTFNLDAIVSSGGKTGTKTNARRECALAILIVLVVCFLLPGRHASRPRSFPPPPRHNPCLRLRLRRSRRRRRPSRRAACVGRRGPRWRPSRAAAAAAAGHRSRLSDAGASTAAAPAPLQGSLDVLLSPLGDDGGCGAPAVPRWCHRRQGSAARSPRSPVDWPAAGGAWERIVTSTTPAARQRSCRHR